VVSGWWTVVGIFAVAWAWILGVNLDGGHDGLLYPVTSYPMFSGTAPTTTTWYEVEGTWPDTGTGPPGNGTARIPLASAFDDERDLRRSLVPPWGRLLVKQAGQCDPVAAQTCDLPLPAGLAARWESSLQARVGPGDAPDAIALLVLTAPLGHPEQATEVRYVVRSVG
jgi:hypothetical protein